ncbi:hypothetical protein [Metabacillus malikii]|uniref:Uncharacterized protein n=1 Tax=Metabacillus malikii TaxID=1504265 RepID=A0ABT9ZGR3_9BACI|nr:hypothetical protein [Metabacillus malikii]MDQ0230992.1 hypothetical protein [Metabacillus malikii]
MKRKDNDKHISNQHLEVDSDVNEDPNRERLLDESVERFIKHELD